MTLQASAGKVILVAVVGGSGAGKSELTQALCEQFGPAAERVSLDDFYSDLSHLPAPRRARVNFDHPRRIDWGAVEEALSRMSQGDSFELPVYDFATHCRLPQTKRCTPCPLMFWEGLWLLSRRSVRRHFAYTIYVDCASEERLSRRIRRDVAERGRTPQFVEEQFRRHVEPMHRLYVAPQRDLASSCVISPVSSEEFKTLVKDLRSLLNTRRLTR